MADAEALRTILLYHVVAGRVPAEQALGLDGAESVEAVDCESRCTVTSVHSDMIHVDEAQVITADVPASSGVIHVIAPGIIPASLVR